MILDPTSPSHSLRGAYGLVDALRNALGDATCPQWTGVGGDSYRARCCEVVAGAWGVLEHIQEALDLVPAFDAQRAQALARSLAERGDDATIGPAFAVLEVW